MKNRIVTLVAALGLAMVLGGCKSDCAVACEKKQECWRSDTDVEACTERCEERSADEEDGRQFSERAEECADCVSRDLVCSEVLDRCTDECIGVVGL